MNTSTITDEFMNTLKQIAKDLGIKLKADLTDVTEYARERFAHLSEHTMDADFGEQVKTEMQNVTMNAAAKTLDSAKTADAAFIAGVQGAFAFGARLVFAI